MAEINSFQIGSVTYDMRDERTKQNLASVFSTGVAYEAGDYAEYDTQLYQFTVDHPAGAWDASQVVAVNLAAGVSEALKSRQNFSTKAPVIINTASGDIATFADGADEMLIKKLVGTIEPVQEGSGDPSPDNVRPISGWTGANIEQRQKNLFTLNPVNIVSRAGITDTTGTIASNNYGDLLIYKVPKCQLHIIKPTASTDITIGFSNSPNLAIGDMVESALNLRWKTRESIDNNYDYIYCFVNFARQFAISVVTEPNAPLKILPLSEKTTLPINWQSEAGTIYGGTVTLNEDGSADVVSDRALITITGTEPDSRFRIGAESQGYIQVYIVPDISIVRSSLHESNYGPFSNLLKLTVSSKGFVDYRMYEAVTVNYWDNSIVFRVLAASSNPTIADTKAEIVRLGGIQVVAYLATPITYHFDNIGQLFTYYGTNNIWIDTGSISECDYPADTKLYIDGLTEPDEDMIANANIASGKYFVVNNQLYLSTAAIATGASIIPGTNCTATNIAAALNAINT